VVDIDAAIGYVVAHGDPVDRARLSYLRTGALAPPEVIEKTDSGQMSGGGWPAFLGGDVASVDATCFRLMELDDLGALGQPAGTRGLAWLVSVQRADGSWEEDEALASDAPPWARPGDPEARLYLTSLAGYWLTVAALANPAPAVAGLSDRPEVPQPARTAAELILTEVRPDGTWPSFLATGWYAAAVLHEHQYFYESARIQLVLGDRLAGMSPADVAAMAAALRRVGIAQSDWLLAAARKRLAQTQRSDGGWPSDDGPAFDVHTTLTAIRACR